MSNKQINHHYFILTGAMGSGKSTLLRELRASGIHCVDEPARQILAEQRAINGSGVPDKNEKLFTELMLSRAIYQYQHMQNQSSPIVFDRGIADNIAYAELFGMDTSAIKTAAELYAYNHRVFLLPGWQAIYTTDDERKMSYEAANQFGESLRGIYTHLGYEIIDVPCISIEKRVEFILASINS